MSYAVLCDKCGKLLNEDVDDVEIRYAFKKNENSVIKTRRTINLCADCYKELFGDQLEEFKKEVVKWQEED